MTGFAMGALKLKFPTPRALGKVFMLLRLRVPKVALPLHIVITPETRHIGLFVGHPTVPPGLRIANLPHHQGIIEIRKSQFDYNLTDSRWPVDFSLPPPLRGETP